MNKEQMDELRASLLKKLGPDYMTLEDAAVICGCTVSAFIMRAKRGQLNLVKQGKYDFIKRSDVNALKDKMKKKSADTSTKKSISGDVLVTISIPKKVYGVLSLNSKGDSEYVKKMAQEYLDSEYKKIAKKLKKISLDL